MHELYRVSQVRTENYRTKTLIFDRALAAQPGQFVMAWLPDVDERPYSVAGADPLALTVVSVGPFSEALHRLSVGDPLWIRGPLGQGFTLPAAPCRQGTSGGWWGIWRGAVVVSGA